MANILITGASGYLGGEIIAQLGEASLPSHGTVFALVRTNKQSAAVRDLHLEPLTCNVHDGSEVEKLIIENDISIVFWMIDAFNVDAQVHFITALAKLKAARGVDVHFLHTSGAKIFSNHAGTPTDRPIFDTDEDLYNIQKKQEEHQGLANQAVKTNNTVIEQSLALGVRSYIFIPCIVYGEGRSFGNPISIQTVDVIKSAKALGRVYRVEDAKASVSRSTFRGKDAYLTNVLKYWPVSHITDTASLYVAILRRILDGGELGHGKEGYYLGASGSVTWDEIYSSVATAMKTRGVIADSTVVTADDVVLEQMAHVLGSTKDFVPIQLSGRCSLIAKRGKQIGWEPKYGPRHIIEALDAEVEFVLKHI